MGELRQIDVKEVSLVRRAANRRNFLVLKEDGGESHMAVELNEAVTKGLEDAMNEVVPNEEAIVQEAHIAGPLDAVTEYALRAGLRLLKRVAKTAGGAVQIAVQKMSSEPVPTTAVVVPAAPAVIAQGEIPADLASICKALEPAQASEVIAAWRANPAAIAPLLAVTKSQGAALATLGGQVRQLVDKQDAEVCEKSVRDLGFVTDAEIKQHVDILKAMPEDQRKLYLGALEPIAKELATLRKADVSAIGSETRAWSDGSAFGEVQKRAADKITKSDGKLDEADALSQVLGEDPQLAARYRSETRQAAQQGGSN